MATKQPCKRLELDAMTNREVLGELTRIYGNLLDRISAYADVLDADHEDSDDVASGAPDDDFDQVYDQAIGRISRIEEAEQCFRLGGGSLRTRDGDSWHWGLSRFKASLKERAVAGLVGVAS